MGWAGLGFSLFFFGYILLELAAKPLALVSCGCGGNKHASHHDCSLHLRADEVLYGVYLLGFGPFGPISFALLLVLFGYSFLLQKI